LFTTTTAVAATTTTTVTGEQELQSRTIDHKSELSTRLLKEDAMLLHKRRYQ